MAQLITMPGNHLKEKWLVCLCGGKRISPAKEKIDRGMNFDKPASETL